MSDYILLEHLEGVVTGFDEDPEQPEKAVKVEMFDPKETGLRVVESWTISLQEFSEDDRKALTVGTPIEVMMGYRDKPMLGRVREVWTRIKLRLAGADGL